MTRSHATTTALSTAIFLEAETLPGGLSAQLANQSMMVNITQTLYVYNCVAAVVALSLTIFFSIQERYMSTAAKKNYFLPQKSSLKATSQTFVSRLFMVYVPSLPPNTTANLPRTNKLIQSRRNSHPRSNPPPHSLRRRHGPLLPLTQT